MSIKVAAVLVCAAGTFSPAFADEGGAGQAPIVVIGRELQPPPGAPAYGTVSIDRDRLVRSSSGRIEDVLSDVAGFQQFRRSDSRAANPSAQGATLRALGGNASSRTLVLLDGVPVADPFFGYIPFSALVPEQLGAVRVTRGAGNGAFGAGAVAGVIELTSASRSDLPLLDARGLYGSRNANELSATLSPRLGAGFVSLSARRDSGDGFFTTPVEQRVPATARARYDSWSVGARSVVPVGNDAEIQARLNVFRDSRTLRFIGADSASEGEDASIRLLSHGPWQLDALAYIQARNFRSVTISASTFRKSLDQYDTPSTGLGGKIELRPPVGARHVLRIGGDIRAAQGNMYETGYNANVAANPVNVRRFATGRQVVAGAFAEDNWTLGAVVLTASARADRWTISDARIEGKTPAGAIDPDVTKTRSFPDRSGWEGSFRGGALWHALPALDLRAAAYTGFRLPTLNELYRGFTFPVTTLANANLAPERLRGIEGGIDLRPLPGIGLGLTVFHNRLENAIANVTIGPPGSTTRQRQNVRAIVAEGVELTGSAKVGRVTLSASYAYVHSKVEAPGTQLNGLAPAQSPRQMASGTVGWTSHGGVRLSTTLRYVGPQYEDDLQTNRMPGAFTVGGYAELPVARGISVVGRAENIFDEKVITRLVVTNGVTSSDIGTPQTFWLGLKIGV